MDTKNKKYDFLKEIVAMMMVLIAAISSNLSFVCFCFSNHQSLWLQIFVTFGISETLKVHARHYKWEKIRMCACFEKTMFLFEKSKLYCRIGYILVENIP